MVSPELGNWCREISMVSPELWCPRNLVSPEFDGVAGSESPELIAGVVGMCLLDRTNSDRGGRSIWEG